MADLNIFQEWVLASSARTVDITLGEPGDNLYKKIWAYDFELEVGQHVSSVDEIDLEKVKREKDLAKLEELKAKYEQTG